MEEILRNLEREQKLVDMLLDSEKERIFEFWQKENVQKQIIETDIKIARLQKEKSTLIAVQEKQILNNKTIEEPL